MRTSADTAVAVTVGACLGLTAAAFAFISPHAGHAPTLAGFTVSRDLSAALAFAGAFAGGGAGYLVARARTATAPTPAPTPTYERLW